MRRQGIVGITAEGIGADAKPGHDRRGGSLLLMRRKWLRLFFFFFGF